MPQIVGDSATADGIQHAFLMTGSAMTDLNSLLAADAGWQLYDASDINDSGQIVGVGVINGQNHAFLLDTKNSTPEPSSMTLVGAGAAGFVLTRKRLHPFC